MTRNGIEYDLPVSPYKVEIGIFTLHFSSRTYEKKFVSQYEDFKQSLEIEMINRYHVKISGVEVLAVPYLYAKIEKRGFYVTANYHDNFDDEYFYEFNSINEIVVMLDQGAVLKQNPQYSNMFAKRA